MRSHLLNRSTRYLAAAALAGVALSFAPPASAVQFVFQFDSSLIPPFETPDGQVLMKFASSAAKRWERALPQSQVIPVNLRWKNYTDGTLGFTNLWNNIAMDADLSDNVCSSGPCPGTWFFDPTPDEDSEFDMKQVLFGQLPTPIKQAWFEGSPPSLLEVGFGGPALSGIASGKTDFLGVLVHELGHAAGIDNWGYDYDIHPDFIGDVGGVQMILGDLEGHLDGQDVDDNAIPPALRVCMTPSTPGGFRWLPGAAVYAAVTTNLAGSPDLILPRVDFLGNALFLGPSQWDNRLNWEGGRVPSGSTETFVRGGATVHGASGFTGTLNIGGFATVSTDDHELLVIGEPLPVDGPAATTVDTGGTLRLGPTSAGRLRTRTAAVQPFGLFSTNGGQGEANDSTSIAANGILLVMPVAGSPSTAAFTTTRLDTAGEVGMGGGVLVTFGQLNSSGLVQGTGVIHADTLLNDGLIRTLGGPLSIGPTLSLDLDGEDKAGPGPGRVEVCQGNLSVDAIFTDDFDGTFSVCGGNTADLGSQMWRLGRYGELTFWSGASQEAILDGAGAELHGLVTVHADHASVKSKGIYVDEDASLAIYSSSMLDMVGETRYCGGKISGAGTLRQTGTATVSCDTTMSLGAIELGGLGGTKTHVDDGVSLLLETGAMGVNGGGYDGGLLLGTSSSLTVNMTPSTSWEVAANGVIVLGSGATVAGTSIDNYGALLGTDESKGGFFVPLLNNQGLLAPGGMSGLGALYADRDYYQGATGTLDIDIGDIKNFDTLVAKGLCTLNGKIEVHLLGGYVPQKGDSFDIASCEGVVIAPGTTVHGSQPLTGENVWQIRQVGHVAQIFVAPLP